MGRSNKETLNTDLVGDLSKMSISSSNNNNNNNPNVPKTQEVKGVTRVVVKHESSIYGLGPREREIGSPGISRYQPTGKLHSMHESIRLATEKRFNATQTATNNINNNTPATPVTAVKEEAAPKRLMEMIKKAKN